MAEGDAGSGCLAAEAGKERLGPGRRVARDIGMHAAHVRRAFQLQHIDAAQIGARRGVKLIETGAVNQRLARLGQGGQPRRHVDRAAIQIIGHAQHLAPADPGMYPQQVVGAAGHHGFDRRHRVAGLGEMHQDVVALGMDEVTTRLPRQRPQLVDFPADFLNRTLRALAFIQRRASGNIRDHCGADDAHESVSKIAARSRPASRQ